VNTTTRAGFTKNTHGRIARCYGANHKDHGVLGTCDGCGVEVAKTDDGRVLTVYYRGDWGARKIACWSPNHECDATLATAHAAMVSRKIESGEIIKGQIVIVVRGRKIPQGTTGTIVWTGDDGYGKTRVGIKTEDGETVFTAASNVEVAS
jgi:hypothetical protein